LEYQIINNKIIIEWKKGYCANNSQNLTATLKQITN
jgi:hypothetical protein